MSLPLSEHPARSSDASASAAEDRRPWAPPTLTSLDILSETGTGGTEIPTEKVVFVTPLGPTTS